jgi:hypothetical protein
LGERSDLEAKAMRKNKAAREPEALEKIDEGRRTFIRRVAAGTAFAVPMVASFSTDGLHFNTAAATGFGSNQTSGFFGRLISFLARLFNR